MRAVFDSGKQFGCRGAKLFILKNNLSYSRICFTFTKSFGSAVARNRDKRLSREAYRHIKGCLAGGYDFILLIYSGPGEVITLEKRAKQLEYLFNKAGLFK
ncbi:MAG: ribonuclease P protein component [Treponema sp.]|nr:ribonuclease P protein component [Treponema sp.]